MKFIAAFGATNIISLDVVPVTNLEYLSSVQFGNKGKKGKNRREISAADELSAMLDPDGIHANATFERAKGMCDGATSLSFA